jgi:hypothetical protein
LRRTVHRAGFIALLKKSIFNLRVNTVEPLLGPLRSLLISSDLCFQLSNPIFSRAQLIRKFLRHTKRVSAVFVGDAGRSLHQLQDCAAGRVELVTAVCRAFFSPRKRDHIRLGVAAMI